MIHSCAWGFHRVPGADLLLLATRREPADGPGPAVFLFRQAPTALERASRSAPGGRASSGARPPPPSQHHGSRCTPPSGPPTRRTRREHTADTTGVAVRRVHASGSCRWTPPATEADGAGQAVARFLRRCIVATGPRGSGRGSLSLSARPRPVRYSSSKDAVRPRRLHQLGRPRTWRRPGRGVGALRLPRYDTHPAGWGVELVPPINATCHAWRRSGFLKSRLGHEITDRRALSSTDRV
jgi:hypothetical protein